MSNPGFRITRKTGFHITFENGWTVSVQFGPGNYCLHHDRSIMHDDEACGKEGSPDAEVAAWAEDGGLVDMGDDTVDGWYKPVDLLHLLNVVAALPREARALPDGFTRATPR